MERQLWVRRLTVVGMAFGAAAVVLIVGELLQFSRGHDLSMRQRLELYSQIANPSTGILLVGAALALVTALRLEGHIDPERPTPIGVSLAAAGALGAVLILAALYTFVDYVIVHVPEPTLTDRVAIILQRLAGGGLGALALWLAVQPDTWSSGRDE